MTHNPFESLLQTSKLTATLDNIGWTAPTPIQSAAIPEIVQGSDLLAVAMTGSGKTGAYLLPVILRLLKDSKTAQFRPLVLVLVPTRELAQQVAAVFESLAAKTSLNCALVYGGVGYAKQRKQLAAGVHVLIATPGRLIDLMDQGQCLLDKVRVLVLDEADRMLDMGFQPAIETIAAKLPSERQSLFFSATFPPPTRRFATKLLKDPKEVFVDAPSTIVRSVQQFVMPVDASNKQSLLYDLLVGQIEKHQIKSAIVFMNSRVQAGRVTRSLTRRGLAVAPIHGGMSQSARDDVLGKLKSGSICALLATDVLARGIDVDSLSFVVNYDVPLTVESYVHRIGRTARAGKSGVSLTFVTPGELDLVQAIEQHIDQTLIVDADHPYSVELPTIAVKRKRGPAREAIAGQTANPTQAKSSSTRGGTSERGVETKTKKTRSGKTITVEYKAGSRKRSLSGKIRAGRPKRKDDDKYKPAWKKRNAKKKKT